MAVYDDGDTSHIQYMQTTSLVNYAGAVVSLALVAGVSIWGYNLIMRDVSGIPVVRAAEGAMRVAPQDAGGEIANNTGLSVNEVAGDGVAAGPSESLLLAPQTPALAEEDLRVEPLAEADEVIPLDAIRPLERQTPAVAETELSAGSPVPESPEDIAAFVDGIAGNAAPLTALAEGEDVAPTVALDGEVIGAAPPVDPSVPGVAVSLRPTVRPASLVTSQSAPEPIAAVAAPVADVVAQQVAETSNAVAAALAEAQTAASAPLATGTHLVQLGAYPSADVAAQEWTRISGQFASFMTGKDRVIQEATSGGSSFFRLRASGFTEAAEARRFCETLQAQDAECIPVVVR